MKKLLLLTGFLAFSMLLRAGIERYYIGVIEISREGIPLTILIDASGTVRLNEAGAFLTPGDADRLRTALRTLIH